MYPMTVDQFNSLDGSEQQRLWAKYMEQCVTTRIQPSMSDFSIYLEEQ